MPTYFLQSDPANPPPGLNASHLVETEMVGESSLTPYICAQGTSWSLTGGSGVHWYRGWVKSANVFFYHKLADTCFND